MNLKRSDVLSKVSKDQNLENGVTTLNKDLSSSKTENGKLKRKLEALFGQDPEESSLQTKKGTGSQNGPNLNYVSTTLHVNIFTNGTSKDNCGDKKDGSKTAVNKRGKTSSNSSKNFRIDVSLPNNELYSDGSVNIAGIQFSNDGIASNPACVKKKVKKKHNSLKRKAKKPKVKYAIPSLSSKSTVEEDSSIQELWSILGMASPTEKSSIIKSNESSKSLISDYGYNKTVIESQPTDSTGETNFDRGAVCQISETFSLAHLSSKMPSSNVPSPSSSKVNESRDSHSSEERSDKSEMIQENVDGNEKSFDDTLRQDVNSSDQSKPDKIGKIRVKSIDSLMKPPISPVDIPTNVLQLDPTIPRSTIDHVPLSSFQSNNTSTNPAPEIQTDIEANCGLGDTEDSKKCFFNTYKFYFNKSVESKITKLGEILHLAIGDEIRRKERIKAATHLSSQHFITEEKQRACNDFQDVMKLRGEEFAPPFCSIFQEFEENSQVTLFFALLYRILKSAIQIDPRHKYCVSEAKAVILTMLSLSNIKYSNILSILKSDLNEFVEQLNIISRLVDEYYLVNMIERQLDSSKGTEQVEAISQNIAYQGGPSRNVSVRNDVRNISQNNATLSPLFHNNKNIPRNMLQNTSNVDAMPPSVQSKAKITETQISWNPSKATLMSIPSVNAKNKDIQPSVQYRLHSSHTPVTNSNVSMNKAGDSLPNSNITSVSNSSDPNNVVIPSSTAIRGNLVQMSKAPHNTRRIPGNAVMVRLLGKTNHDILSKEVNSSNRNPNIVLRMPLNSLQISTSSSTPTLQFRPVSVLAGSNNTGTCSVQNKTNHANDVTSSNINPPLTSYIRTTTSQSIVNNSKAYQATTRVNSASRETSNERRAMPDLLEIPAEELSCKDATTAVNTQVIIVFSVYFRIC